MAHPLSLTTVAAVAVTVSLSVCSEATAQSAQTTASSASPTTRVTPLSDAEVRSDLRRLQTMKTDCVAQAQQALNGQRAAVASGRLSDVDELGQALKDKMACVDKANRDLLALQTQVGPAKVTLFMSEDRFHQEYRQGLQAQVDGLQRFSERLADADAITYEIFARQMAALRRYTDAFKNRYIRLLKEAETRELATAVFQAEDLFIASAQSWKEQVKAEADITELTRLGPSAQLSRALVARDAALMRRANQWETAQRHIAEAVALAATR